MLPKTLCRRGVHCRLEANRSCFNSQREEHAGKDRNIGFAFYDGAEAMRPISILPAFMHGVDDFLKKDAEAINWVIEHATNSVDRTKQNGRMRTPQPHHIHANYLLPDMERHASHELRAASSLDAGGWGLLEAAVSPEDALPRAKLDLNARPIPSAIGA